MQVKNEGGAADMAAEVAGEATVESVQTDLRYAEEARGGPEKSNSGGSVLDPTDEIGLPGPTYKIDNPDAKDPEDEGNSNT